MVATKCQRIDLTFGTAGRFGTHTALIWPMMMRRVGTDSCLLKISALVGGHINLFVDVVDEDGNVVATYEVS